MVELTQEEREEIAADILAGEESGGLSRDDDEYINWNLELEKVN
jgi:hypothetical protein